MYMSIVIKAVHSTVTVKIVKQNLLKNRSSLNVLGPGEGVRSRAFQPTTLHVGRSFSCKRTARLMYGDRKSSNQTVTL